MILCFNARFAISNNFSTVFFDSYYLGVPVVLYTRYYPELARLLGGKSEGGEACDYFIDRHPVALEKVLRQLIYDGINPERRLGFLLENCRNTQSPFWRLWKQILGNDNSLEVRRMKYERVGRVTGGMDYRVSPLGEVERIG